MAGSLDISTVNLISPNGLVTKALTVTNDGVPNIDGLQFNVPAGAVLHFAMSSAPSGWLKANGSAVSRTAYASLFSAIGTTFGVGDGSATFNLPDLRGEFLRGYDDGRGVDSGHAFGGAQGHQLQSHNHNISESQSNRGGTSGYGANWTMGTAYKTDTTGNVGTFGTETRPRNVALLACIKY